MSDLLVIAPLLVEAAAMKAPGLRIVRCGMGQEKATATADRFLADSASHIVVAGFGGALDPTLEPGTVVVADQVLSETQSIAQACESTSIVDALRQADLRCRVGRIVSTEAIATGDKRKELHEGGAIAVDMESAFLAPLAAGRRFSVVRVIVDTPTRELSNPLMTITGGAKAARTLSKVGRALNRGLVQQSISAPAGA